MHIASRPTTRCQTGSPLLEESCSICLQQLEEGDTLRSLECAHYHHQACLDKWLKLEACCPICKTRLPGLWGIQLPQEPS
eukprot:jgi/Astpho2/5960/e_gw1.00080.156.1_t